MRLTGSEDAIGHLSTASGGHALPSLAVRRSLNELVAAGHDRRPRARAGPVRRGREA